MPPMNSPPLPPADGDDRFRFSLGNANPELWATTTPLVVVYRCKRHKGLIATWRAIHWLIVLHSRSGKADFGVREIAEEADVGRNELCDSYDAATGAVVKRGYISMLCEERLIDIVGQVAVPGGRKPRNVYSVDLARLIAESALLAPEVLRLYGAAAPPRPQIHPDQLTFFSLMEQEAGRVRPETVPAAVAGRHQNGTAEAPIAEGGVDRAAQAQRPDGTQTPSGWPENGTVPAAPAAHRPVIGTVPLHHGGSRPEAAPVGGPACPDNGTVPLQRGGSSPEAMMVGDPARPETGPVYDAPVAHRPDSGTVPLQRGSSSPEAMMVGDPARPETGPVHAAPVAHRLETGPVYAAPVAHRPETGTAPRPASGGWAENGTVGRPPRLESGTVADQPLRARPENGTAPVIDRSHRPETVTVLARNQAGDSPTDPSTPENGTVAHAAPSRIGDMGWMDGWMDGGMDGWGEGGRATDPPASGTDALRAIVRAEIEQALSVTLRTLLPLPTSGVIAETAQEAIPPAPDGELPIEAGPEQTWATLNDRALTGAERSLIREIIRRYAGPSRGAAAYWLVRAMHTVALDDKPRTLNYVGGVLKRLKRAGRWDSEELALAAGETREEGRQDAAPPPDIDAPRAPPARRRDPAIDLPPELRQEPAVQAYIRHAPAGIALAEIWAHEMVRRVHDLALWESNCQNWRARYDYANVRGLLERHEADARTFHPLASARDREPSADPLAAIAQRLSLADQERIIALADAMEARHQLTREAWTWALIALADGRSPEEVEQEAIDRFAHLALADDGGL